MVLVKDELKLESILFRPLLRVGSTHVCHAHNTGYPFCAVTTVFNATTTGPNIETTQTVFSHSRSLQIIQDSSPQAEPGLPLSVETCFPQSALAAGKQTRQMLWEWGPHEFTVESNFLAGGILMNHSEHAWLSACQSF